MEIREALNQLPPPSLAPDSFFWLPSKGPFSFSDTWEAIKQQHPPITWSHLVWYKKNIPRFSFITWLAMLNRLKTMDRLHNPLLATTCVFCRLEMEDHDHLLFRCPFTSNIWCAILARCGESYFPCNWSSFVDSAATSWNSPWVLNWIKKICLACTIYTIWKERNARVFSNTFRDAHSLCKEICSLVFCKLLSNRQVDEQTRKLFFNG